MLDTYRPKSNLRGTWKIIKPLNHHTANQTNIPLRINGIPVDNPVTVANEFNEYFTSIGPKLAATISNTQIGHSDFLNNLNPNSFFLNPITTAELNDIIFIPRPLGDKELPNGVIKKV